MNTQAQRAITTYRPDRFVRSAYEDVMRVCIAIDASMRDASCYHQGAAMLLTTQSPRIDMHDPLVDRCLAVYTYASITNVPVELYVETAVGLIHPTQRTQRNVLTAIASARVQERVQKSLGGDVGAQRKRARVSFQDAHADTRESLKQMVKLIDFVADNVNDPALRLRAITSALVALRHSFYPGVLVMCPRLAERWREVRDMRVMLSAALLQRERLVKEVAREGRTRYTNYRYIQESMATFEQDAHNKGDANVE